MGVWEAVEQPIEGPPLFAPSLLGSHLFLTGGIKCKNGRETGERTIIPPVPSALCVSMFDRCDGSKGGTF